jgi:hypothetical protein
MAKILKVKIKRAQTNNIISNTYPLEYDSKKIKVLAYEGLGDINKTFCIGVVNDVDAPAFLASKDIIEINQEDAQTLGVVWRPQTIKITDESKIIEIIEKVNNKEVLTQAEKDAINPDNATRGVNKSKPFNDLLTEALNG